MMPNAKDVDDGVIQDQHPEESTPEDSDTTTRNDGANSATKSDEANFDDFAETGFRPIVENILFKDPHYDNSDDGRTGLECGMSSLVIDVSQLPPLPKPRSNIIRHEANFGIAIAITLSILYIGITHGVSLTAIGGIEKDSTEWLVFLILIYSMTGIAGLCLLGLLFMNPGVVPRNAENSFPIPLQCEAWILAHLENSQDKDSRVKPPKEHYIVSSDPSTPGDTYCTRCLVWRRSKDSKKYFHCQLCQRCVADYDHHCSVFGRCIAGSWRKGNYSLFILIITMGMWGQLTTITCLIWSLSQRYNPRITVPISVLIIWLTSGILMGRVCVGSFMTCRNFLNACSDAIQRRSS